MDLSTMTSYKQVKIQYWLRVIHECRASGMTNQAWCIQNGISLKSYYYWIARIRKLAIEDLPRKENGSPFPPLEKNTHPTINESRFEEVSVTTPVKVLSNGAPAAVIRFKDISVDVFEHTSDSFLRRLMEAVRGC